MSAKLARLTRARRYAVDPLSPLQTPPWGSPRTHDLSPSLYPSSPLKLDQLPWSTLWLGAKDEVSQA